MVALMMQVCYFGAFRPSYARNDFLRRSLELAGCAITLCNVPVGWPTYRKYPALIAQYLNVWRKCDIILVAEFGQTLAPLAWALGRLTRRPMVFDLVIGLYESNVIERRSHQPDEFEAKKLFWLDQMAGKLADRTLTGTAAYKDYLVSTFGFAVDKVLVAPLGVNDAVFHPLPKKALSGDTLTVLYYGSFIPNHGVEVIVQAATTLRDDRRFKFRFVGDGESKPVAMDMAARLGLPNVEFWPRIPLEMLPTCIAEGDIVLGVFGDTPQADKAMANKVLQGLAMKKPVVSGDTRAVRENFRQGEHLWLCPLGDAQALASALRALADPALRSRLAEEGYQQVMARLTPAVVGKQLHSELAGLIEGRK